MEIEPGEIKYEEKKEEIKEKTEVKEDEHALLFFIFGVIAGGTSPWFLLLIQKRRS